MCTTSRCPAPSPWRSSASASLTPRGGIAEAGSGASSQQAVRAIAEIGNIHTGGGDTYGSAGRTPGGGRAIQTRGGGHGSHVAVSTRQASGSQVWQRCSCVRSCCCRQRCLFSAFASWRGSARWPGRSSAAASLLLPGAPGGDPGAGLSHVVQLAAAAARGCTGGQREIWVQ